MATLVSLQLVRVAGVEDHHAASLSFSERRSRVVLKSRLFQGSGLKISSLPKLQGGSLQGGGSLCCPLWSHLLITKSKPHTRAVPMPTSASSIGPVTYEHEIKRVAVMLATSGALLLRRTASLVQLCPPLVAQVAPAVALVAFSIWGLGPTTRSLRKNVFKRSDKKWDESRTYNIMASYMRPISLWIGIILICRAFDPVVLSTEASQIIKQRFINFVRSLSTVLAFAFCTASLTQQVQRFMMENQDAEQSRNVGVQFIGNTVYTSVWIAAVCLFMELLGFSTQKWITAGGFGTVLITLAGREIFTNFLSSIMIHATRPFIDNEWIQTKIEGQEVSGTVEHVGWWSPTVIRGDDREAVHIPNQKFSVSVVRNLSQKTHWRIKTHLGISHLDVNKMTPIVADMRKVLAKHPQVEQQRLHRRVFFDILDSENQALLILVSCFVKTSHFEEYLRVKEIILLDLLKVIGHHNARLATPIRSVQRVVDESESRSAGFRDMRNANQAQRGSYQLLDSQVLTTSDDEEDDSDASEDISDEISRLSSAPIVAKVVANVASIKSSEDNGTESGGSVEEQSGLKFQSETKKPREKIPAGDGNLGAGSSRIPVIAQQNTKGSRSAASLLQDSALTLMDRIHAGTEERLVRSHKPQSQGNATSEQPVAATHVPPADLVVEIPEEKVPHLYSNNVGNDVEIAPRDDQAKGGSENAIPSLEISVNVHGGLSDQEVGTTLQMSIGDHQEQAVTLKVNDKHVGVHVGVGSDYDPWRQPSSGGNVSDGSIGAASPVSSNDPSISNESVASSSPASNDDDHLWKKPSTSQVHNPQKTRVPNVDPNLLVPGVAIEGPKHTIPLDEDVITRDDYSRTLVASRKQNSSSSKKERRESSGHGAAKGTVSSDTRDRER